MRGTHPTDLKTKDSGLRTKVTGTSVTTSFPKSVIGNLVLNTWISCLEHAGMTEGVRRILYPIQQITLNERALVTLCLGWFY
ncbi:MAG: hypothetical protein HFP77_08025 [Methylococcales symbiont of Iophon sp. n. MRB-2018]|nr:MAG: hypothetical protein HFP77_08025 [Methylococcales symbiont of Iophon sp. n. MRB-2018]KAF3979181.1 MAG: hypothetical protein HFP76_08795 [Methylococcales symbiont of Iophon sp. n. MRB-2018]